MHLTAYSVYDSKVGIFHPPAFFLHHGQAMRAYQELAGDMSTTVGRHPADFSIFELGIFNDQTGVFEMYTAPKNLGTCASLLPPPPQMGLPFAPGPIPTATDIHEDRH